MGPYTLPSESPSPTGKFKNIELLRFLMAWAIVGAHIVYGQGFVQFGLGFLEPYLYKGSNAVPMFFVIAFFFLSLKTKPEQPFFFFIVSKWLRLAPLVIAVTVVAYILHLFSFWGWSHELNIGNILLIQDWSVWPRWRYFVHPAWYCHAYLLLAIFYLGLIKAFDQKYVFFVLGVCAYIGWRIFGLMSVLPEYGSLLGHYDIGRGLFCLGLATLLTHLHKIYPPPTTKTHYLLHRSRTSTFWGRFRESVFWQVECSYFSSYHTRIQSIILFVHSTQGASFPFFRKRLVRFIRSICLRHFYRACTRFKCRTKNCTTTLQISGTRAPMACSGGHSCYYPDLGHHGLSLCGGTYCSLVYSF